MAVSRFRIARMDCGAEENLVRMALAEVPSIQLLEFRLDQREVLISHATSTQEIEAALLPLGLGAVHVDDSTSLGRAVDPRRERLALVAAFAINIGFFIAELTVGLVSASVGLVADALDMGADASVYALSLFAVGASAVRKTRLARSSGYLQFGLAVFGLLEVVRRFVFDAGLPDPRSMVVLSVLALIGNAVTLVLLHRVRSDETHMQASWIFTANDIKVNALVILAAIGVALTNSAVPDLVAGAIVFVIVANGARRILKITN